jgi:hypothetical protein
MVYAVAAVSTKKTPAFRFEPVRFDFDRCAGLGMPASVFSVDPALTVLSALHTLVATGNKRAARCWEN